MKNILNITIVLTLGLGFSGCAIKQDDSVGVQTAKHLINSPAYVVVGVGFVATKATEIAVATAIGVPALAYQKAKKSMEEKNGSEEVNQNEEIQNTEDEIKTEEIVDNAIR